MKVFSFRTQGAWFDPSVMSTLSQDIGATVPVLTDSHSVALMLDKSSNGHHATQATVSARPIYRTDGTRHWLEFDGFDDHMLLEVSLNINTGTILMGLKESLDTPSSVRSALISSGTAGYVLVNRTTRTLANNFGVDIRDVDRSIDFPMTDISAVGIRVVNDRIFARRWPNRAEHFNVALASSGLGSVNTFMALSPAEQIPVLANLYDLVLHSEALAADAYARALSWMNDRIEP